MPDELIVKVECPEEFITQGLNYSFSDLHVVNKDFVNGSVRLKARIEGNSPIFSLFERLKKLADDVEQCREYKQIMTQLGRWDIYLGNWENDVYPLRMNVGEFMKRTYEFIEEEWKLNREEICSRRGDSPIPSVRGGMQYLLKRNFPKLSTIEIGQITKRNNHCSVILNLEKLSKLNIEYPELIELHLPKIVKYLKKSK
jgi:hypothetical protein